MIAPAGCNKCGDQSSMYEADRNRDPMFYTKTGWLNTYALACGYQESLNGYVLRLEGVFHVQGHGTWESFDNIRQARHYFRRVTKEES